MITLLLLVAAVILLILLFIVENRNDPTLPPRKLSIPIIGNLYLMESSRSHLFMRLSRELNSHVVRFTVGSQDLYIVNGHDPCLEVLRKQTTDFRGRDTKYLPIPGHDDAGIVWTTGENWAIHRNRGLKMLKTHEAYLENYTREQAMLMVESLASKKGVISPREDVYHCVASIIHRILFGGRELKEENDQKFLLTSVIAAQAANGAGLVALFPLLRWLPGDPFRAKEMKHLTSERHRLLKVLVDAEKQKVNKGIVNDFFVSTYLQDMKNGCSGSHQMSVTRLVATARELFFAGMDTVSATLVWAILLMINHPDIQERVREEIHSVIGERSVQSSDAASLPYTMAALSEIQRLGSVAPLAPAMTNPEETHLDGYRIPKGSVVLVNVASVHWDEKVYVDPLKFEPERFLTKVNGRLEYSRRTDFIPFGAGVRVCMGKNLAKMELIVLFVTLIQRLRFLPPPGVTRLSEEGQLTVTWTPVPFRCVVETV